jgi:hypothetical protein
MYILQTSQVVHVDNLKTQKMSTLIGARELISLNLDQDNGGRYRGLLITFLGMLMATLSYVACDVIPCVSISFPEPAILGKEREALG